MTKEELRQQAAITVLNGLLETTQHSISEALAIKDLYALVSVMYADSLVDALELEPEKLKDNVEDKIKEMILRNHLKGKEEKKETANFGTEDPRYKLFEKFKNNGKNI